MSIFEELAGLNVNTHVEKKGDFNYLKWSYAIEQLLLHAPTAEWEIVRFPMVERVEDNAHVVSRHAPILLPYLKTDLGYFVEVAVTVDGIRRTSMLPVLDHRNKPIESPSTFDINTAHQRCLVKAIAAHGLGLYVYHGIAEPSVKKRFTAEQWDHFQEQVKGENPLGFAAIDAYWSCTPALRAAHLAAYKAMGAISAEKQRMVALVEKGHELADQIASDLMEALSSSDDAKIHETIGELSNIEKKLIAERLKDEQQDQIATIMAEAA